MKYAQVVDGVVVALGSLPASARRLDTGQWVLGMASATTSSVEACGWFPVVVTVRPPDTATTTTDYSVVVVDGVPTEVWTERPKTVAELDDDDRKSKGAAVGAAVATLRQWAADAESTSVTNGNNTAVTQTTITRLGVFFDRFADLIEAQRLDVQ